MAETLTRNGKPKKNSSWTKKRINRVFSLLSAACNFVLDFWQTNCKHDFMAQHEDALRTLYRLAIFFKDMMCERMKSDNSNSQQPLRAPADEANFGEEETVLPGSDERKKSREGKDNLPKSALDMSDMTPGDDAKIRILESMLRVEPQKFHKLYSDGPRTVEKLVDPKYSCTGNLNRSYDGRHLDIFEEDNLKDHLNNERNDVMDDEDSDSEVDIENLMNNT